MLHCWCAVPHHSNPNPQQILTIAKPCSALGFVWKQSFQCSCGEHDKTTCCRISLPLLFSQPSFFPHRAMRTKQRARQAKHRVAPNTKCAKNPPASQEAQDPWALHTKSTSEGIAQEPKATLPKLKRMSKQLKPNINAMQTQWCCAPLFGHSGPMSHLNFQMDGSQLQQLKPLAAALFLLDGPCLVGHSVS